MPSSTPFFASFGALLFGKPPLSALAEQLRAQPGASSAHNEYQHAFGQFIPATFLAPAAGGKNSRERLFSLGVTFWAFLAQVFERGSACRDALARVIAWSRHLAPGREEPGGGTAAYCRARQRLDLGLLERIGDHVAGQLHGNLRQEERWRGHAVYLVDGTSVSMPDTAGNQAEWPQPSAQKPGCGFPVAKLVGLLSLGTGALQHLVVSTEGEGETSLARALWAHVDAGDVIVADRNFSSYTDLCALRAREAHAVMRLHAGRRIDLRQAQPLGENEWLVTLPKPRARTASCTPEAYAAQPESLQVRIIRYRVTVPGFRTQEVVLVTTLLDAQRYPAEALAGLYLQRWGIELHFREIKTWLGMDVLRCLSPGMVRKEVALHRIAYNLIRLLMQKAAQRHGVPVRRISFKGTLDRLQHSAATLGAAHGQRRRQEQLFDALLKDIAGDLLPERPHRSEPRAVKRRPKPYLYLTHPRRKMVVRPHHKHPRPKSHTGLK